MALAGVLEAGGHALDFSAHSTCSKPVKTARRGLPMSDSSSGPTWEVDRRPPGLIEMYADWYEEEWLSDLEPLAVLAWVMFLSYMAQKTYNGILYSCPVRDLAYRFKIDEESVINMLSSAIRAGEIKEQDGLWKVTNWSVYTSSERD